MKYYKVFNPDMTCLDFQFEIGKTYVHNGEIKLCKSGFHFCEKLEDCFSYYSFNSNNRVFEVECENISEEKGGDSKRVCGKITLIKELTWYEVLDLVNIGQNNTGLKNSGNSNSGSYNSGSYNSGYYNSGSYNSGNSNSGNSNSGSYNSGNSNSGHSNSGSYNSGNSNSGSYNSGNSNSGSYNSGSCNSLDGRMMLFNTVLDMSVSEFWEQYYIPIFPILTRWIDNKLIQYDYKEAWQTAWNNAPLHDKEYMQNLPGFTKENFYIVTGINIEE